MFVMNLFFNTLMCCIWDKAIVTPFLLSALSQFKIMDWVRTYSTFWDNVEKKKKIARLRLSCDSYCTVTERTKLNNFCMLLLHLRALNYPTIISYCPIVHYALHALCMTCIACINHCMHYALHALCTACNMHCLHYALHALCIAYIMQCMQCVLHALCIACIVHCMHCALHALCIACIVHCMHYALHALCVACIMSCMHYALHALCISCIIHCMHH